MSYGCCHHNIETEEKGPQTSSAVCAACVVFLHSVVSWFTFCDTCDISKDVSVILSVLRCVKLQCSKHFPAIKQKVPHVFLLLFIKSIRHKQEEVTRILWSEGVCKHTDNLYCFFSARWITISVVHCNSEKCARITLQKGDCKFDFSVYKIQNIPTLKPSYHCFICWHKSDSEPKTFPDINKSQAGAYPAEYLSSCDLSPAIHWLSHFECASAEMCAVVWVLKAVAVAARLNLHRLIALFVCVCVSSVLRVFQGWVPVSKHDDEHDTERCRIIMNPEQWLTTTVKVPLKAGPKIPKEA